jgi:Spy/CpxP family protein refolding chaperone
MFRIVRRLVVPSVVAVALALSAPAFAAPPTGPQQSAEVAHAKHAKGARHERATGLVGEALREANLRAEQRTAIESIKKEDREGRATMKTARKAFDEALATQVRAGRVDGAALRPQEVAMADAAVRARAADDAELDKLHGILDASQRTEVADKVEARMGTGNGTGHGRGGAELRKLTKQLGLTAAQRQEVAQMLRTEKNDDTQGKDGGSQAKEREKKVLESFKGTSFSMEQLRPASEAREATLKSANERVDITGKLVRILTPEQREKLAASIGKSGRL